MDYPLNPPRGGLLIHKKIRTISIWINMKRIKLIQKILFINFFKVPLGVPIAIGIGVKTGLGNFRDKYCELRYQNYYLYAVY
jgi:hypothetical protein